MPITLSQKTAIEEVIHALLNTTSIRSKRPVKLASMFMDLVDRTEWPAYYDVIPEPRCLKNIQAGVEKGRYREASDVYTDLSLVFWNALFYNEADSQIAMDADTLKTLLETEWKKKSVLPHLRTSPPPASAQKVHGAPTIPTRTTSPADADVDVTTPDSEDSEDDEPDVQTDRESPPLVGPGDAVKGSGGTVNAPTGSGGDQAVDSDNAGKKPRSDGNPGKGQQQQQQQPPPPAATNAGIASSQPAHVTRSQTQYQSFQQPYMQQVVHQPQIQRPATLGPDRSIIAAAGGLAAIGGPAQVEKLPAETAKLFDRDPVTNEVLWFAAPPMNMSRARGPKYSLEYLTFIATKRKRRESSSTEKKDVDGEEGSASAKRPRLPTVTETMRDLWKEIMVDGIDIGQ